MFFWLFYNYPPKYPPRKKVWMKIRFVHETDRAVLVLCDNRKVWIPKSRIRKVRLRRDVFEILSGEGFEN